MAAAEVACMATECAHTHLDLLLPSADYPLYYPYFDAAQCTTPFDCKNANAKYRFALHFGRAQV